MTDRELMQMALDMLEKLNKDGWILADFEDEVYASIEALRARLEKWTADDTAYRPDGLPQAEQELVAWSRVNMNDHKEGDLGIGTTPYAAQAAMVDQQTQGRMYVDPVTGDAGIGTVKWDASAPLVVHPHPAFQATPPQQPEQEPVATLFGSLPVYDVPPPEQEPVAWMVITMGEVTSMQPHMIAAEMLDGTHQLYTAPTREWQGLTDDEMRGFVDDFLSPEKSAREVFNAIEQALKEKNNG